MVSNIQTNVVQFKFQKSNTSELLQVPQFSTKQNPKKREILILKKKKNFDFRKNIAKFFISFLV
jgi:hypothetical protein